MITRKIPPIKIQAGIKCLWSFPTIILAKWGTAKPTNEITPQNDTDIDTINVVATMTNLLKLFTLTPKEIASSSLKESTFNSFFNSVSGDVKTFFVENEGYALCEETEERLTVYELFGNEGLLLNLIFGNTQKETIFYRQVSKENSVPYGMYYKTTDVPEIQNGFFGIPYAN